MSEYRRWLQGLAARLDDARARKVVALGAMALLIVLSVGPTVLSAVAAIELPRPSAPRAAAPTPEAHAIAVVPDAPAPPASESVPETSPIEPPTSLPAAPTVAPALAFVFPQEDTASNGPVSIVVRVKDATAVGMIFEIRDALGAVHALPALPSMTPGEWGALFNGEPGDYVLSVRASLDSGYVLAFKEERAFRILPSEPAPPASPDSVIVLIAPDPKENPFTDAVPLAARIKNSAAGAIVFIVTSQDETETLVLGTEAENGGYWTAIFEGAPGDYRVHARATVGEEDFSSSDVAFTLSAN